MKIKVGKLVDINKLEDLVEPFNQNADDLEKLAKAYKKLNRKFRALNIIVLLYICAKELPKLKGE